MGLIISTELKILNDLKLWFQVVFHFYMQAPIQHMFDKGILLDDLHLWMDICAKDEKAFLEFWDTAKDPSQEFAWRALWVMEHAIKKNDALLDLIIEELYPLLIQTQNNSLLRIGLKLVTLRPISSDDIVGKLLNRCEAILLNTKMPIATRANSLQFIFEFCKTEPDFSNELEALVDHIAEHESSAGMRARIRLIKKALHKM